MKDTCRAGLQKTRRITVDDERATRHLGSDLAVYATPAMVRDIEKLCHELLQENLDPGESSVGTRVDVQHLAPTPAGMWVDISAGVSTIDRRAVTFEVVLRDAFEEVGRCTHSRFVVDLVKLKERLAAKIARARAAQP